MLLLRLLPVAAALALGVAGPASASTLGQSGQGATTLTWTGTPADDTLTVAPGDAGALVFGASDAITIEPSAAARCAAGPGPAVTCAPDGVVGVAAHGGEGADAIRMDAAMRLTASGEAGDDTLAGGPVGDTLVGGEGTDAYAAGGGDDYVSAADGVAETVDCGDGTADVFYADAADTRIGCERDIAVQEQDLWQQVNQAKREGMDAEDEQWANLPRYPDGVHDMRFRRVRGGWLTRRLEYEDLQRSARIFLRCRGPRCPLRRSRTYRPRAGWVSFTHLLRGHVLPPGTKLFVTILAPGRMRETDFIVISRRRYPAWGVVGA